MAFEYDLFISYSRHDREWAYKVNESLKYQGAHYNIFFDYESLRSGDDWDAKIQGALEATQHLIVAWSEHAKQSDWVSRELWTFFATANPKVNKNRRLICFNLQGMNQALKAFQQISRPEVQSAYLNLLQLKREDWEKVIWEIVDGLNPDRKPLQIPLVVLTLDQNDMGKLSLDRWAWLTEDFGLSQADLRSRYGETRSEWRPFASTKNIAKVLDELQIRINAALQGYRVDWHFPGPTFWTDAMAAKNFVDKEFLTGELSVLVIDPVAICHPDIYQRLMLFQECFASERTVIVTLPPFCIPRQLIGLRKALMERGMPYFDDYFQPTVPPRRRLAAQFAWNASDVEEVQRHILAAASHLAPDRKAANPPPFIRHGGD